MKIDLCLRSRNKFYLALLVMLFSVGFANAQKITVRGKVVDANGPLLGATIQEQGTNNATISDFDGNFEIKTTEGKNILITYVGYDSNSFVASASKGNITVTLTENLTSLDEVTLIGYGKQKKVEVTGAVANVKAEEIAKSPVADIGAAIQGKVSGVKVQSGGGRPGEAANIEIRGLGSIGANAQPLYVVDGIPQQGNPNLSPDQIETLDILKDGASAAIYGTRAANGVILITTKRGKAGEMKVKLNSFAGIQNITSGTPLTNTAQEFYIREVATRQLDGEVNDIVRFNERAIETNTNFVDDVTQNNARVQNHSLNISGGSKNLSLNLNSNYYEQDGILLNSGFDRFAHRLTGQFEKGKFKAFIAAGISEENKEQEPWQLFNLAIQQNSYRPSINSLDRSEAGEITVPIQNELQFSFLQSQLINSDKRNTKSRSLTANLEYEILKGLTYKVKLGQSHWNFTRKYIQPKNIVTNGLTNELNVGASRLNQIIQQFDNNGERQTFENVLNYDFEVGKNKFGLLGVLSYEQYKTDDLEAGITFATTTSNSLRNIVSGVTALRPNGTTGANTLTGKLFRLQYGYDEKYLVSASFRRDGSSKFAKENRYGNFFGVSTGWNINKEQFFKNLEWDNVSNIKLRASYAQLGFQGINDYQFINTLQAGLNYPFAGGDDENLIVGSAQTVLANENIKWETNISRNIGLDIALFKNRLNINAEAYFNSKADMLLAQTLPTSTGIRQPRFVNGGNMTNKGFEIALGYNNETSGGFKYNVNYTFSRNVNEITDLNGIDFGYGNANINGDNLTYLAVGREAASFFLLESDGVIKTDEELEEYKGKLKEDEGKNIKKGDLRYIDQLTVDTDNDGIADEGDGVIDDKDRVYKGSGQSKFDSGLNLGFKYKGFDFDMQSYFSYGAKIFNGAKNFAYQNGRHVDQVFQWSPQNANSNIPAFRRSGGHQNVRAGSDQFLEDGTYLRIRNITFGYTIPNTLEKFKIEKARIYATSLNPFTFTKYSGYDPEVGSATDRGSNGFFYRGVDIGNYPITRQFMLGVQLQF